MQIKSAARNNRAKIVYHRGGWRWIRGSQVGMYIIRGSVAGTPEFGKYGGRNHCGSSVTAAVLREGEPGKAGVAYAYVCIYVRKVGVMARRYTHSLWGISSSCWREFCALSRRITPIMKICAQAKAILSGLGILVWGTVNGFVGPRFRDTFI